MSKIDKLIVIKTGHSELFSEASSGHIVSMGDVFRCMPMIEALCGQHDVLLFTTTSNEKLLQAFYPQVTYISEMPKTLDNYKILNLEKNAKFLKNIHEDNLFGLVFCNKIQKWLIKMKDGEKLCLNQFHASKTYLEKLEIISDQRIKKSSSPSTKICKFRIGLNWKIGSKWPEKSLPREFWNELYKQLSCMYSVSWQEGFDDIKKYKQWLESCELIITHDSLGLHVANYLNKDIIALFKGTNMAEVDMNHGVKIDTCLISQSELMSKIINYCEKNLL